MNFIWNSEKRQGPGRETRNLDIFVRSRRAPAKYIEKEQLKRKKENMGEGGDTRA